MTPAEKVAALRRLAASTTFEGERESALAKAAELETRGAGLGEPPRRPPTAPPAWPEPMWQYTGVTVAWGNTTSVTVTGVYVQVVVE